MAEARWEVHLDTSIGMSNYTPTIEVQCPHCSRCVVVHEEPAELSQPIRCLYCAEEFELAAKASQVEPEADG